MKWVSHASHSMVTAVARVLVKILFPVTISISGNCSPSNDDPLNRSSRKIQKSPKYTGLREGKGASVRGGVVS
jgi:hypothetical protein